MNFAQERLSYRKFLLQKLQIYILLKKFFTNNRLRGIIKLNYSD